MEQLRFMKLLTLAKIQKTFFNYLSLIYWQLSMVYMINEISNGLQKLNREKGTAMLWSEDIFVLKRE